ncbi:MAG: hypothetical protein MUE44_36215, partial [Oscillatoriaceae cyanobacterium Prado104]|nr:hypothetical protein [Oscillatoriaceae cyanobacterium Prado104]
MLSLETEFNRQDFASSIAGFSSETLDLFNSKLNGQFDRLNLMASMVSADTKSLLDSGNWENGGSIDLTNSFSDFGFLETSSNNLAFDKSQSDISAKVQRDELTGMDFAPQDGGGNIELVASQRSAVPRTDVNLDLKSYTIQHQGLNTLNIKVDYGLRPGT